MNTWKHYTISLNNYIETLIFLVVQYKYGGHVLNSLFKKNGNIILNVPCL